MPSCGQRIPCLPSRRSFSVKPINIHGGVGDFGAADAYWPPGVDDDQRACTSVVNGGDDRYLAQSADLG
jgi:hypothetical protein